MLFDRHKRLLALLDVLGGRVGSLDFQKLLFLACQEMGPNPPYEFVPYKFGAFSFTSYADRRKLVEEEILENDEHFWALSSKGRAVVDGLKRSDEQLRPFVRRYKDLRGDALVADTYRRYPYFATRSEIAGRLLANDEGALRRIDAVRPVKRDSALSTLGYEGRTLESYLNRLLESSVTLLCDVRRNPISRKYGFSKSTLLKGCEGVGIRYEHLPELGIASEQRRNLNTQSDYDALFIEYERDSLPYQGVALSQIQSWVDAGEHVVLTCYEESPNNCHRHCVAEAMERRFGQTFKPNHL